MLAAQPIISEFMASNDGTLEDGDGSTPDWIELYNHGDQSVDLENYRLTDDPADLNKWLFPSVDLEPGEFLVVFASGDNTPDSAGNLHTNFQLSASGEYVALVSPGGAVLSEFGSGGTEYPPQEEDVSYGLAFDTENTNPVTPDSVARYWAPTNSSADATWTSVGFDDSSWGLGTASIGYENSPADYDDLIQTTLPTGTTSAYVRIDFNVPNAEFVPDTLQMKFDDGFIAYLNGTRIASANAPANPTYQSVSTDQNPDAFAVEYADFDLSAYPDVLNVGTNTLAIHMLNTGPGSSDLLAVPNLTLTSGGLIEPVLTGALTNPTPGLPNTSLLASDVQFSQVGGVFANNFQLSLTAGAGEFIRYTTDGTNPDETSPLYTGPITVSDTVQIRARAFGAQGQVGRVQVDTFVRSAQSVVDFDSDLPVIVLENFGQGVPDRDFQDASFSLYDIDPNTGRSSLSNTADFTSVIGQHRRGKSTFDQPKYNLRLELRDQFGADQNESLLGMPSESDWILYAPFTIDRAMIRNALTYDLGRQAGDWAPRTRFVEVYSNTDGGVLSDTDYFGVYVLMEVIKRDNDRVDIEELTPSQNSAPEITGGYLVQIDQVDEDDPADSYWDAVIPGSGNDLPTGPSYFFHSDPERRELTNAQTDYIRGYIQDAVDALYGANSTDPNVGYAAYFGVDSAVKFHLFNAFTGNPDAFRLSTYLTKDRGGKLEHGPLWDFDRGMGPDLDNRTEDPTKWMVDEKYFWVTQYWRQFFEDPDFTQLWADEWQELRETVFSDANLTATVDALANPLDESQVRNAVRWSGAAPNGGPLADPGLTGWEGEISHLKNWLLMRADWIDQRTLAQPGFGAEPGNVPLNTQVSLSVPSGSQVWYTLDGSDPRADGGGVAPGAIFYSGPITISQTTQITARAFNSSRDASPVNSSNADEIGQWSGINQGLFSVELPADPSSLRITELHYHPANATPGELAAVPGAEDNDFEFIELKNVSANAISLNGVTFDIGITFDFTTSSVTSLAPGETVVVVEDLAAFEARYGTSPLVAGQWSGSLSNSGEAIVLTDSQGAVIHSFSYSDDAPWPTLADGDGPSLVVVDTEGDYSAPTNWRLSAVPNGTPGVEIEFLPGDYNRDLDVDQQDYQVWLNGFGSVVTSGLGADGNGDGVIDSADYTVWRDHQGQSAAAPAFSSVIVTPGPSAPSEPLESDSAAEIDSGFALLSTPTTNSPLTDESTGDTPPQDIASDSALLLLYVDELDLDRGEEPEDPIEEPEEVEEELADGDLGLGSV